MRNLFLQIQKNARDFHSASALPPLLHSHRRRQKRLAPLVIGGVAAAGFVVALCVCLAVVFLVRKLCDSPRRPRPHPSLVNIVAGGFTGGGA